MGGKKLFTKPKISNNSTKVKPINNNNNNKSKIDNVQNTDNTSLESDDDENPISHTSLVPADWYKYEDHCGYDREGRRILKPSDITELEKFISEANGDKRLVKDQFGNVLAKLSDRDLELIERICKRQYPNKDYDPEALYVEFDKSDSIFPVKSPIYRKDSYLPSKHEFKIIKKIIEKIRRRDSLHQNKDILGNFDDSDDIWKDNVYKAGEKERRRMIHNLPAPKLPLPKTEESYNPPLHLIKDAGEVDENENDQATSEKFFDEKAATDVDDEDIRYIPKRYESLRHVPGYKYYLIERFERCMDLYLCPRARRVRMNIDIKSLLASVPKMDYDQLGQDISVDYYTDMASNMSRIDHTGRYVAVVSGVSTVHVFNLLSGRNCYTVELGDVVIRDLAWHPSLPVLAIAKDNEIIVMAVNLHTKYVSYYGDSDFIQDEDDFAIASSYVRVDKTRRCTIGDITIRWKKGIGIKSDDGEIVGFTIYHHVPVIKLNFHTKGSYIAAILQNGTRLTDQVIIHSVKKQNSIFLKANVANLKVNRIIFHPTNSQLIVGSTQGLMLINLKSNEGKIVSRLGGLSEVLSLDVNNRIVIASGDNGTVSLYDLQDNNTPIKSFNFPNICQVKVHQVLPLAYIIQESGKISVFYVKTDENDLISVLPCKQLNLKSKQVKDFTLHPYKSWFITANNDTRCLLYV